MKLIVRLLRAGTFTPAGMVVWAVFTLALLAGTHLAGWREQVTVLSGTLPAGASLATAQFKAMIYLVAWFGTVAAAPILLLAAGLLRLWNRHETSLAAEAAAAESSARRR